ncbi:MAG: quinone-dependent dihydroorotate dehydrogenase [Chitinophagales bacterium]
MYKSLVKPLFFRFKPETAHHLALSLFRTALLIPGYGFFHDKLYNINKPGLEREVFGITFKNPVGLAAGFDKNAEYIDLMARLGFGHIEVGTVTPLAQPGNDKPRLFRLKDDFALINRMGFNNAGVDAMVKNLSSKKILKAKEKYKVVVGANIGKNKTTTNEDAWKDYVICFEKLFDHADYFVVNVSSPNTPGLRELQEKEPLKNILNRLQEINQKKTSAKPLLLKIAPDLTNEQLKDIVEITKETRLSGIIATNTTIDRTNLKTSPQMLESIGTGGLSGKPLAQKSNDILWFLRREMGKEFTLIGVGGIMNDRDVQEKMNRGANLVQLYTGMIYEGQGIVRNMLSEL